MGVNQVWGLLVVLLFLNGCLIKISGSNQSRKASIPSRPNVVKIGSILTFNSIVGKVGKIALEAAVEDVNSDPAVLNGTKLELTIHDSNSSGFVSILEALQLMESESVALIGVGENPFLKSKLISNYLMDRVKSLSESDISTLCQGITKSRL
ncbi:hypothetical protein LXL04_019405 [Taraxacum kok-saghyz]